MCQCGHAGAHLDGRLVGRGAGQRARGEIRQDLVNTEDGAERWATILDDALRDILADPELYRIWQSI